MIGQLLTRVVMMRLDASARYKDNRDIAAYGEMQAFISVEKLLIATLKETELRHIGGEVYRLGKSNEETACSVGER